MANVFFMQNKMKFSTQKEKYLSYERYKSKITSIRGITHRDIHIITVCDLVSKLLKIDIIKK